MSGVVERTLPVSGGAGILGICWPESCANRLRISCDGGGGGKIHFVIIMGTRSWIFSGVIENIRTARN
jgi:hypothetical protein